MTTADMPPVTRLMQPTTIREDHEWTPARLLEQTTKIQECMKLVMKRDEHYGIIPGTGTADRPAKPTLLKPGAEKLCLLFRLDPEYEILQSMEAPERVSYMVRCTLYHIPTGSRVASGLGSCNSREDKYLRPAPKKCPHCSKETIFKSKHDEGGWYCWAKKGGCGAQFVAGDPAIEQQDSGLKDPADLCNTILKMGCKRALVAAVLNATAASDFFTQDLDDLTEKAVVLEEREAKSQPKQADGKSASDRLADKLAAPGPDSQANPEMAQAIVNHLNPPPKEPAPPPKETPTEKRKRKLGEEIAEIRKQKGLTRDDVLKIASDQVGRPITNPGVLSETQMTSLVEKLRGWVQPSDAVPDERMRVIGEIERIADGLSLRRDGVLEEALVLFGMQVGSLEDLTVEQCEKLKLHLCKAPF